MVKRLLVTAVFAALLSSAQSAPAAITEREPNDTAKQATLLGADLSASGIYHKNDQDWYKLTLPAAGKVTAAISGLPADCQMQVTGFRSDGTNSLGSGIGQVSFEAPAGDVYVRVSLNTVASGVCAGSEWCAVRCQPGGPWHVTPEQDGTPPRRVPATEAGSPVLGPIAYTLHVSSAAGPTTPGTHPPVAPPATAAKPQGELIRNSALSGSGNWTVVEWYRPSDGKGEVFFDSDGVRFWSRNGNNRIGILQDLNLDVSGCSQLLFTATVKADQHRLTGTGWNGREAPVAVFAKYTDASGALHDLLSENPSEPRNMFWQGVYFLDPVAPSVGTNGTRVSQGIWFTSSVDLMARNPKPRYIHFVGAEGAGWATRDAKISSLSLQCR